MKKIVQKTFLVLMLAMSTMAVTISAADAKRLGGGGSIGKQSSNYSRQAPSRPAQAPTNVTPAKPAAPAAAPAPAAAAAAAPKPASPWKGIVGGALLGLGAGALLSHLGLGGAGAMGGMGGMGSMFSSILMIGLLALAAVFLFRMFSRKNGGAAANSKVGNVGSANVFQPAYAAPIQASGYTPEIGSQLEPAPAAPLAASAASQSALQGTGFGSSASAESTPPMAPIAPWGIPADFDVAGFVRSGKSYFIRLQAAWDRADINDIREFTTPEMFAELRLQLQERGSAPNNTDVVKIDGELLGIETLANDYLATLKFTGLIKEAPEASAEPFTEIWNLSKPLNGSGGWVLAGIQQA